MSLSTPILTTSSEIDTRVDDCSATAVVMKDDTDKAQMMSVFLIMDLLRKMSSAAPPSDVTDPEIQSPASPAVAHARRAATQPRRRAWLRIFVVQCSLRYDPPVGVIHAMGG